MVGSRKGGWEEWRDVLRRTHYVPRYSVELTRDKRMSPIFFWDIDFMLCQI